MPYNRSHPHKLKRLNGHVKPPLINNLPSHFLDENFLNKPSNYIKYFDYPLAEILSDHSTDPLQNTTRQYNHTNKTYSNEGRFTNHEMIIRRNGETTILRPKQDLVLANGFTPVIRPSSLLPSYPSIMSHSQVPSSLSIMNKMSINKPEQATIIKTKRKKRHRTKRCNEQNSYHNYNYDQNNSYDSTFIHLVNQALHDIVEERQYSPPQPVPLMSILPQFPNYQNQSFKPPLCDNYFYQDYVDHEHSYSPSPRFQQRNYSHMSGYFFN